MRNIFMSLFLLVCAATAFGQDSLATPPKGISEQVKKKVSSAKDRLVIDISMTQAIVKKDGGITVPNGFKLNPVSPGVNVYYMYDIVLGKKQKVQHFSIAPGAGIGFESFYFNKYGLSWLRDSITRFSAFGDSISAKKSKMNVTYIDIPLEFRYRSSPSKKTGMSWKLAVGFKFGFLVGSKWKYKGEDPSRNDNVQVNFRESKIGNMNKLRYGPTIRGGYGPLSLFCYYSIGSTFVTNKGPKFNPIVFGISINGL